MKVIVSVYDSASELYSVPYFQNARGEAMRSFMDAVSNKESSLYHHPEHFSLFEFGKYDELKGTFDIYSSPVLLAKAWELSSKVSS